MPEERVDFFKNSLCLAPFSGSCGGLDLLGMGGKKREGEGMSDLGNRTLVWDLESRFKSEAY